MTKVLIIGGGIAGSVTAIALHKAGIDSVVYEAQPADAAAAGAFLTIGAHRLDALRVLDADKLVIDNSFAASTSEVYGANGQLLNRVDFGGPRLHTLTRDSLLRLLHGEVKRLGIQIVYGKRIADAMTMPDDSVGVQLARCLRDLPDARQAFEAFESLRRERVERVVALSAGMARSATPSLSRRLQRKFTKSKGRAKNRAGNADWLNSYSIDWDARVSP